MAASAVAAGNIDSAVDRANLDPSTSPGENFYQYACGGWMKANPLSPEYARYGTFDQLGERSRDRVKEIVTTLGSGHARGTNEQKVSDLYALGMDSVRLNKDGAAPLRAELNRLKKLKRADVIATLANYHRGIAGAMFDVDVVADFKNSAVNMFTIEPASLSMGDRDYYLENDANSVRVRNAFADYVTKVMQLAGMSAKDAANVQKDVLDIETQFARVALTREESRDVARQYNIMTPLQLRANYPNINWDVYFSELQLPCAVERVCVLQPASLAKANELMRSLKDKQLRNYLAFKYVNAASSYLSDDFEQARFDFYDRAMSGKQVQQPRWKRALGVPNTQLGEAVGQLYVARYFPPESKRKMQTLVDNLRRALAEHIATLSWMSAKTKVNALVKLNSFTVKIGYPDNWRDYSAVNIDPSRSYWDNVLATHRVNADYELSQLGKPVNKDRWWMTPQTVNAYYEPSSNEICFPAAILQAPFFDPNADDACNYGAIGVVIGHEMTHGFDDQGREFDSKGNMEDWWTAEDAAKFKELADKLADQFSAEIVADDVHANGRFTLGENIADHGGLRVAYSAFKQTAQGKGNTEIDGFTPDQRFYLSYANVWAQNITKEEILRRTKVDPHSLGCNRVNVSLRNIEPFFNAFGIHAGDKMWRDPQDRVIIW